MALKQEIGMRLLLHTNAEGGFHGNPNTNWHDHGSAIGELAFARNRERTLLRELAITWSQRELWSGSKDPGLGLEVVFHGRRTENGSSRLGRAKDTASRGQAALSAESPATFQLSGIDSHREKAIFGYSLCFNRCPFPTHTTRLTHSSDVTARA